MYQSGNFIYLFPLKHQESIVRNIPYAFWKQYQVHNKNNPGRRKYQRRLEKQSDWEKSLVKGDHDQMPGLRGWNDGNQF